MKPSAEKKKQLRAPRTAFARPREAANIPAAPPVDAGADASAVDGAAADGEEALAGGHKLTAVLVGRICLVSNGERRAAVFVDTIKSGEFRRHTPVLRAGIDDVTQDAADVALVTMADDNGRVQVLWKLEGADMKFEGIEVGGAVDVEIEAIPDLRAVYAKVDSNARWRVEELLDPTRMPDGVLARLWLDGFVRIDSMDFDGTGALASQADLRNVVLDQLTFIPGQHVQVAHSIVRCTAVFREAGLGKPTLVLTDLSKGASQKLPFEDLTPVDLTFSNLCTCVGEHPEPEKLAVDPALIPKGLVVDDPEFACYYGLLEDPPKIAQRPIPFVPEGGVGSVTATQCVPMARLR